MKVIKLNCLCLTLIFFVSYLYGADSKNENKDSEKKKQTNEIKEYYADKMPISSVFIRLHICIKKWNTPKKNTPPKQKKTDIENIDNFQIPEEEEEEGLFTRFNSNAIILVNGFYIEDDLLVWLFHLKEGQNQILFDFSKSPFISKLENGDKIIVEFSKGSSVNRNIYKKEEFTYKKGKNKYLWTFEIKKLTFKPQWINAKVFTKLSDTDKDEIRALVNKLISAYKNKNIETMLTFVDSLRYTVNLDKIKLSGRDPKRFIFKKGLDFLYKNIFYRNRRSFKSTKSFSITLNESNKRVVNVFPRDNNPIYRVESNGHSFINKPDGTPDYRYTERYGLNFIYINGKWQIY